MLLQLDCLQDRAKSLSGEYHLVSQRKGFRRYMTDELQELVKRRAAALSDRETAMAGILQVESPFMSSRKISKYKVLPAFRQHAALPAIRLPPKI